MAGGPPADQRHYLLAFGGGRVVAGATREAESGFDYRVTAAGQREVLDNALAVAPGLADATLAETRVGFRPGTPDGLPILGPDPPGPVVSTGFGAGGLTNAPFAGKLVAAVALGEDPGFDLTPFHAASPAMSGPAFEAAMPPPGTGDGGGSGSRERSAGVLRRRRVTGVAGRWPHGPRDRRGRRS